MKSSGLAFDLYSTLSFWTGALIQLAALAMSLWLLAPAPTLPANAEPVTPAAD